MVTNKIKHKDSQGNVTEVDIGAQARNISEDSSHMFVTDTEKKKVETNTFGTRLQGSRNGDKSFVSGTDGTASGGNSHAEGTNTVASGDCSHAEGVNTVASGQYSHAEGANTLAKWNYSHAEGYETQALTFGSHSEGESTKASGKYSHAEGTNTVASGNYSHAEGGYTSATGQYSHAEGFRTTALSCQRAEGHYNNTDTATSGSVEGVGTGSAIVIGNGTSSVNSNAFRVNFNGQIYAKSSTINTGADYAEYFEWEDGNPDAEDRVGLFVTFSDKNKVKIAGAGDYILGIVSGNPCVIGNGDEDWSGRFKRDFFNRFVMQDIDVEDPETGEIRKATTYVENPDYDSSEKYIQRFDRKEWDAIGMIGVLPIYDDSTCQVNSYCKCADGGIATAVDKFEFGTYRVIERVTENIVKVVFK